MARRIIFAVLSIQFISFAVSNTQTNTSNSSDICYLPVYGRTSQKPVKSCPEQDTISEYQCFPPCKEGYSQNTVSDSYDFSDSDPYEAPPTNFWDSFCWEDCPTGFDEVPRGCAHLTPYGKQEGYNTEKECLTNGKADECEKCDYSDDYGLWYPTSSCGSCTTYCPMTSCPPGMPQNGSICMKHFYNRTALFDLECAAGYEPVSDSDSDIFGTVCYPTPKSGFTCEGPVCTGTCPKGWQVCGYNFCVKESHLCDNYYVNVGEDLATGLDGSEGSVQLLTESDLPKMRHELTTIYFSLPVHPICPYSF